MAGRPTLYRPEYAEIARRYCVMGATNDDLAKRFGVSPRTVDDWIADNPEFGDGVRQGRDIADIEVAEKLFTRATGFSVETTKAALYLGETKLLPHTLYFPPDVRACIFWLRNRRPKQWREPARPVHPFGEGPTLRELEAADERASRSYDD